MIDPVALVTAIAALVAAVGVAIGAIRSGNRNRRLIETQLDTHNDKTSGDTLHDVAQTMQYVADVQHEHTRTLDAHGLLIEDVRKRLGYVEATVRQMAATAAEEEEL